MSLLTRSFGELKKGLLIGELPIDTVINQTLTSSLFLVACTARRPMFYQEASYVVPLRFPLVD